MRTLRFLVNGNEITQDPSCDFSGLFPCLNNDVQAEFQFSSEWNGCTKVAAFYSMLGTEYPPAELEDSVRCPIPKEALSRTAFKIQIFGKNRDIKMSTRKLTIFQRGSAS